MKQWDIQHIGIFDINFDTGELYWSAELRRILRVPDGMPPEFLILLQHVHPDDRRALVAFAMEPMARKMCATPLLRASSARSRWHCALGAHRSRHSFSYWQRTRRRPCNRTSHGNRGTENVGNSDRKFRVHR